MESIAGNYTKGTFTSTGGKLDSYISYTNNNYNYNYNKNKDDYDDDDDVYVSLYKYTSQRDDILSFNKGDIITVLEQPDSKWWVAANNNNNNNIGFVPASYLKKTSEEMTSSITAISTTPPVMSPPVRRAKPPLPPTGTSMEFISGGNPVAAPQYVQSPWEPIDFEKHDPKSTQMKQAAMTQLMNKIKHVHGTDNSNSYNNNDDDDDDGAISINVDDDDDGANSINDDDDYDYRHKIAICRAMIPPEDTESQLIQPKRIINQVMASQPHKQLQKELVMKNKRGELRSDRSELDGILHVRKRETSIGCSTHNNNANNTGYATSYNKLGLKSNNNNNNSNNNVSSELKEQLERRSKHLQQVEENDQLDRAKPEFMKIKLRKSPTS